VFYSFTFVTSGLQPNGADMICVTLEIWFVYIIYLFICVRKLLSSTIKNKIRSNRMRDKQKGRYFYYII